MNHFTVSIHELIHVVRYQVISQLRARNEPRPETRISSTVIQADSSEEKMATSQTCLRKFVCEKETSIV